MRVIKQKRMG